MSSLIVPDSSNWDTDKVKHTFVEEDARLILSTRIPQHGVYDRIAWSRTTDGQYDVNYVIIYGMIITLALEVLFNQMAEESSGS